LKTRRFALSALALCLPLALALGQEGKSVGSKYSDALIARMRTANKVLSAAQKADEDKRFKESSVAWVKLGTEFRDTRLIPEFIVQDIDFRTAEAFAQSNDADAAFMYLEKAITTWPWHNNLEKRNSLKNLYSDPRWNNFQKRWNQAQSRDLTPDEKIFGLSQFWQEAKNNFAYFDKVPNLNWDAAYREYIPKVLATKNRFEYVLVLRRFCALLKDGHTNIYAPNDLDVWGSLPINVISFGERVFVGNVLKSEAKNFPIGTEVLSVNGQPVAEYVHKELEPMISSSTEHIRWRDSVRRLSSSQKNTTIQLTLKTPQGEILQKKFTYDPENFDRQMTREMPNIPNYSQKDLGDGVVLITLGGFESNEAAEKFVKAVPELQKTCKGLILDIRNNGGGNSGVGLRIARRLTDKTLKTSAWRTREIRSAYRAWGMGNRANETIDQDNEERIRHFLGEQWYAEEGETIPPAPESERLNVPVVVLTDYPTASAAEDFLIALDGVKGVTRVGRKTYGSTGQPIPVFLPGNIQGRVCTKRDTFPDGRDFVGVGVIPDVAVEPSPEDYFANRDVILERGRSLLKEKMR
jgi:carboxyl-terminal processing protease